MFSLKKKKVKTEYAYLMWGTVKLTRWWQQECALGQVLTTTMQLKQNWKYREKAYKLKYRTGKLQNSDRYKSTEQ